MKLKPQDLFIGVIDFFSVILPGKLSRHRFIYLLMSEIAVNNHYSHFCSKNRRKGYLYKEVKNELSF